MPRVLQPVQRRLKSAEEWNACHNLLPWQHQRRRINQSGMQYVHIAAAIAGNTVT